MNQPLLLIKEHFQVVQVQVHVHVHVHTMHATRFFLYKIQQIVVVRN